MLGDGLMLRLEKKKAQVGERAQIFNQMNHEKEKPSLPAKGKKNSMPKMYKAEKPKKVS